MITRRGFFGMVSTAVLAVALPINAFCAIGQPNLELPQTSLTMGYNQVFIKFLYDRLNESVMRVPLDMPEKSESGLTFRNFMAMPPEAA